MPEALKCPTCAAPLDYPAAGGASMRCPYCNSTVVLSEAQHPSAPGDDLAATLGPLLGSATDIPQVAELLRSGKKIEAIKIIRQTSGANLAQAKEAVENLAAGRPAIGIGAGVPSYNSASAAKLASSGLRFGCGLAMTIILVVGIIIVLAVRSIHNQLAKATPASTPTLVVLPPLPGLPAPVVPTFAHVAMEFGAEGIGAGLFKDSRSVAVDGQGHIYVGEYSDGRIQVFDAQGKFIAVWSIGRERYMQNLAADRHGTLYVCSNGHIYRFEGASGMPQGEMETNGENGEETYMDAYAALSGDIYAIDSGSNVVILGPDGKIKSEFSARDKVGEDVNLERIAALSTGEIYALDRTKGVFKFAPDGRYINRFGGGEEVDPAHRLPGQLFSPNNIAVDGAGRVYVSDDGPAIQVFDGNGHYLDSFGGEDVCFGLTINDKNEIFGCFRNQHTVRKFVLDKP
ncbi:MAG: NHL repeat-containing protein [Tepidisphaeraceae bacterium]